MAKKSRFVCPHAPTTCATCREAIKLALQIVAFAADSEANKAEVSARFAEIGADGDVFKVDGRDVDPRDILAVLHELAGDVAS